MIDWLIVSAWQWFLGKICFAYLGPYIVEGSKRLPLAHLPWVCYYLSSMHSHPMHRMASAEHVNAVTCFTCTLWMRVYHPGHGHPSGRSIEVDKKLQLHILQNFAKCNKLPHHSPQPDHQPIFYHHEHTSSHVPDLVQVKLMDQCCLFLKRNLQKTHNKHIYIYWCKDHSMFEQSWRIEDQFCWLAKSIVCLKGLGFCWSVWF